MHIAHRDRDPYSKNNIRAQPGGEGISTTPLGSNGDMDEQRVAAFLNVRAHKKTWTGGKRRKVRDMTYEKGRSEIWPL